MVIWCGWPADFLEIGCFLFNLDYLKLWNSIFEHVFVTDLRSFLLVVTIMLLGLACNIFSNCVFISILCTGVESSSNFVCIYPSVVSCLLSAFIWKVLDGSILRLLLLHCYFKLTWWQVFSTKGSIIKSFLLNNII